MKLFDASKERVLNQAEMNPVKRFFYKHFISCCLPDPQEEAQKYLDDAKNDLLNKKNQLQAQGQQMLKE